jgi:hypothetical protein
MKTLCCLILALCALPTYGQILAPILFHQTAAASQVATPTFSPAAGTYSSTQTVTISTTTPLAVLCYTTDGSTPTEVSNLCSGGTTSTYSTPISVATTQTVKAIGTKALYTDSAVGSATYTISAGYTSVATYAYNYSQGTYSSPNWTSPAVTLNAGETVVVCYYVYSTGSSLSDVHGNTMTQVGTELVAASTTYVDCYRSIGVIHTGSASFVINNANTQYARMTIWRFTGISSYVQEAQNFTNNSYTWSSGSLTSSGASVFVGFVANGNSTFSPTTITDSRWDALTYDTTSSDNTVAGSNYVSSGTTTINFNGVSSSGINQMAFIMEFQ